MKYLTASEMRTFQRCQRKWWLQEYRGMRKLGGEVQFNRPLGIGNRVHEALAAYYTPEDSVSPLEWLSRSRDEDLSKFPERQADILAECELAEIMLTGYVEWLAETGEDQALTVIEAEKAVVVPLEAGSDVSLLTKLDARVSHDEYGSRLALEHKTTGAFNQLEPELRINPQALTEHLAEYLHLLQTDEDPETAQGVLFNMLRKVKRTAKANPPFYKRVHVRHTKTELRNHWYHVVALADQIEEATRRLDAGESHQTVVPPAPMGTCAWQCQFFQLCPMFDAEQDAEMALLSKFIPGNSLERYDGLLDAASGASPTRPLPDLDSADS
jgi:hypothetical protein